MPEYRDCRQKGFDAGYVKPIGRQRWWKLKVQQRLERCQPDAIARLIGLAPSLKRAPCGERRRCRPKPIVSPYARRQNRQLIQGRLIHQSPNVVQCRSDVHNRKIGQIRVVLRFSHDDGELGGYSGKRGSRRLREFLQLRCFSFGCTPLGPHRVSIGPARARTAATRSAQIDLEPLLPNAILHRFGMSFCPSERGLQRRVCEPHSNMRICWFARQCPHGRARVTEGKVVVLSESAMIRAPPSLVLVRPHRMLKASRAAEFTPTTLCHFL